jgi:hypothetical protein
MGTINIPFSDLFFNSEPVWDSILFSNQNLTDEEVYKYYNKCTAKINVTIKDKWSPLGIYLQIQARKTDGALPTSSFVRNCVSEIFRMLRKQSKITTYQFLKVPNTTDLEVTNTADLEVPNTTDLKVLSASRNIPKTQLKGAPLIKILPKRIQQIRK